MTRHAATLARWTGPLCCAFAVACSSPAPPYSDLSLRDALGADPDVLVALPAPDLSTIAERLEAERLDEHDDAGGAPATASNALEAVRAVDDARRTAGDDALVVATVVPRGDGSAIATGGPEGAGSGALPPLEGPPAAASADAEALALQGHAGQIVAGLLRSSGSRRLARVTRWPVGALAAGGVVYVNASWLVAMSALEPHDGGKPRPVLLGGALLPSPARTPRGLTGSPFATYPTLAACVADVTAKCDTCLSGGECDSQVTLTDFSSSQAECAFLVGDGGSQQSLEELCVLALTSISTVSQCVEDDGCAPPPSNRASVAALPGADAFLASDTCVRSLDLCLSGQNIPLDAGSGGVNVDVKVQGCLGPVQACSSAFDALGDACSKDRCSGHGGPSCSSCSGCATCSSCSQGTRTGSGTGYGSAGTGQNPHQGGSSSGSSGSSGSGGSSGGGGDGGSDGGGSGSGSSSGAGSSSGSGSGSSTGSSSGSSGSGGGGTTTTSGTSSNGCGGCTGGGSGGGSSCTGGGCSSCSSNSGSSSSSSSSGGSGCQGCGGSGSSSGSSGGGSCNNQCSVAPDDPAPAEPPVSLLWMALPVIYLQRRVQLLGRRS
jgi:hypothetical protein